MPEIARVVLLALLAVPGAELLANEWSFEVYLDDRKVGTHVFEVVDSANRRQVQSTAEFNVKFLFFNAYRYRHTATEQWDENCLRQLDARTRVNGEPTAVSGESVAAGFVVEKSDSTDLLPECVMTFAYWNPEFLKQERLLNPQTGEYLDVSVELVGADTLDVRGKAVNARHYRVTAKDIDLSVWYANDDEWVALQSVAKSGHIIRYELS